MIENPNSCGQGYDPTHYDNEYHNIIRAFGYVYSHSTIITALDGTKYTSHCYKLGETNREHNVSVNTNSRVWMTSTGCSSGRHWQGLGQVELIAHLRSKRQRYSVLKP